MTCIDKVAGVAAACCLITAAWAQEAARGQERSAAESGWAAMTRCAAITDDGARHACSDDVLRNAGLLPPAEAAPSERRKRFGLKQTAAPENAGNPGKPEEDQLEVTLAAVDEAGDGKLILTTTDGAVWRQVEREAIRPIPLKGQMMTIAKASFGSFLCKPSKWIAFRCFRAR